MDLKQLEYIIAIAEEKSISRAAARFYLSPSALSQYLTRLQAGEGLPPLFRREKGQLLLTDAGRVYVNGARTILSLASKLEQDFNRDFASIRMAATPAFEYPLLTRVVPRFTAAFPEARLQIRYLPTAPAKQLLKRNEIDIAVLPDYQQGLTSFCCYPVFEDEMVWLSRRDLEDDPYRLLVILPHPDSLLRGLGGQICTREGITGSVFCETADFQTANALLHQLPLTAILPRMKYMQNGGLKELPLSRRYPYQILAALPKGLMLSTPMKGLLELIMELLPENGGSK